MERRKILLISFIMVLVLAAGLLTGCGESGGDQASPGSAPGSTAQADDSGDGGDGGGESAEPEEPLRERPEFKPSSYHGDRASSNGEAYIDVSSTKKGYVAASAMSDSRLKFQVIKGDETYTYDLDNDGTPRVYPLQCGNGTYTVRIMENVVDNKYAEMYTVDIDVKLRNEFQPYLRPNIYVPYSKKSDCVKKANELAEGAHNEEDVIKAVYDYVTTSITYDKEKAENATTIVLPEPDETMATGKGICFDYASLTACMLRSQGIPTKLIFGYVSPDDVYHAWNMFYTEETGWVQVKFDVDPNDWNRIDLTFSAGGTSEEFIGDGTNYSDVYQY
ncbi:MAG: transglutaminase domain-containing protein [Firmicutes bacterium]|nr:transglutaminase domain-containing protein [Bacillota bacterium]